MIFKRKIYQKLCVWKNESDGHTALLIEGARRVGKSTIAEEFGKNEYKSYVLIDFTKAPAAIINLFDDISDLNWIFMQIQLYYKVELYERESLIIFDEIQFCPKARQAIKHLVADHRYDYLETGSLISIKKNVKDILIPSEEDSIEMVPMDYEEFLWAMGDTVTMPIIRECFIKQKNMGDDLNRKLMRSFRLYMLVGGMPRVVSIYLETRSLNRADAEKRRILKLYDEDFRKIDPTGRISMLFDAIPAELEKNASRYQVSSVLQKERADTILDLIAEMKDSKTVLVSYHANDPQAGLSRTIDLRKFKLFVCDTGLFTTLCFKDKEFTENIIYEKLLSDKLPTNLGYMYENVVAQILTSKGEALFYHTFMNERSRHNYEIDFLISRKNKICPLEIKSSGYNTHASLDAFCEKYSKFILEKYVVYTKDMRKEQDILYLPLYMTECI